jgi:TonB family protein
MRSFFIALLAFSYHFSLDAQVTAEANKIYLADEVDSIAVSPLGIYGLSRLIRYPAEARMKGVQGEVVVGFVVELNGEISDIRVVQKAHPLLDDETLRVVHLHTSGWTPAIKDGKYVRSLYSLPMKFFLR